MVSFQFYVYSSNWISSCLAHRWSLTTHKRQTGLLQFGWDLVHDVVIHFVVLRPRIFGCIDVESSTFREENEKEEEEEDGE